MWLTSSSLDNWRRLFFSSPPTMLQITTILLVNFLLFKTCRSSGKLSILLSKYNNTGGKLADGSGCDWDLSVISEKACDHYFKVCVDQPNGSLTDMRQCAIGEYQTESVANRNQIDFRQNKISGNPKILPFNIWQGGFTLKAQVWDKDTTSGDDLVELLSKHISTKAAMSRNKGVTSFELKKRTQLTVKVAVFCDDNWYGPRCDCQPSSNASGHYYCNSTTGDKNCSIHWYGPNCTVNCWLVNGTRQGYDCGPDGRKMCLKNWYGSNCNIFCQLSRDEKGHYECATNGSKVCKHGWTGENCNNIDECASGPCSNPGGQCVNKINGYLCECLPGYTGPLCETKGFEDPVTHTPSVSGHNNNSGFNPKVAGIVIGVLVLIIAISVPMNIWKVCLKRKKRLQPNEIPQDLAIKVNLDDIEPYYISKSAPAPPLTDDNPYSDIEERRETGRNTYCNMREGAANDANMYINQREETDTEANAYLNPREDVQANTYLELLPN